MVPRYRLRDTDFEFSSEGGPIDAPEKHPILIQTLGLANAAWARMETLLTALVMHINQEETSNALHDPDPAEAFKRKSKLLESWIAEHPPYAHLRTDDDSSFFTHLRALAVIRNKITHGLVESYDDASEIGTIKLLSRVGKDTWAARTYLIPIDDITNVAALANTANRYFMSIADEVFERVDDGGDARL